jgi:uncharacterized protein with HEPN domain
VGSH